jgi:hypothetical protein
MDVLVRVDPAEHANRDIRLVCHRGHRHPLRACRWVAPTAGRGQANDEAPRTSFFQVTFDRLVVPVPLRSPSRQIGHEDIPHGSQAFSRVRPGERSATTIHIGAS